MYGWDVNNTSKLIELVEKLPYLYNKSHKDFKDANMKNMAWETIGGRLIPPCSGKDASARFKYLRDVFVRERKKINATTPASGAGADDDKEKEYKSTWEYYISLLFLKDHISTKRTKSNFQCPAQSSSKLSEPGITLDMLKEGLQFAGEKVQVAAEEFCSETFSDQDIIIAPLSLHDYAIPEVSSVAAGSPQPACSSASPLGNSLLRAKAKRGWMESQSPKPEYSKKFKEEEDKINSALSAMSETMRMVADCVVRKQQGQHVPLSESSPKDAMTLALEAALAEVAVDKRISCVIELLKVVDAFRKGAKVRVIIDE